MTILLLLAYGCAQETPQQDDVEVEQPIDVVDTEADNVEVQESVVEVEQAVGPVPTEGTVIVNIKGFAFNPETITIPVGTVVTWINKDSAKHTATSDEEAFDSPLLGKDEKFSFTFDKPGTFSYYCKPHPYMLGTVIVE
ncbi:cupredoxin family copper-binding protein [Candidatus Woesearchaeota archaeon]|nr:cupredoxin family copper-binding protein [Candidatus Woesearchaeota archaeon]